MSKRVPMKTGGRASKKGKSAGATKAPHRTDSMPKGYTCKTLSQR